MKLLKITDRNRELVFVLRELRRNARFRSMRRFVQHGSTSTYTHCENVAALSLRLAGWLPGPIDRTYLVRGAFLHDFYLYDWHIPDASHRLHGFSHAAKALENADRQFALSDTERNIIYSHMWPMNLTHLPHCREAVLVCLSDKLCALGETFRR